MKFLAFAVFYPLLWLRSIFVGLGKLIGGVFTLIFVVLLAIKILDSTTPVPWLAVVLSGVLGFGSFLLLEFYDNILLRLNPTGNDLALYK
jgi:hypothetical protein